jgi:chromosome segregation ATPase
MKRSQLRTFQASTGDSMSSKGNKWSFDDKNSVNQPPNLSASIGSERTLRTLSSSSSTSLKSLDDKSPTRLSNMKVESSHIDDFDNITKFLKAKIASIERQYQIDLDSQKKREESLEIALNEQVEIIKGLQNDLESSKSLITEQRKLLQTLQEDSTLAISKAEAQSDKATASVKLLQQEIDNYRAIIQKYHVDLAALRIDQSPPRTIVNPINQKDRKKLAQLSVSLSIAINAWKVEKKIREETEKDAQIHRIGRSDAESKVRSLQLSFDDAYSSSKDLREQVYSLKHQLNQSIKELAVSKSLADELQQKYTLIHSTEIQTRNNLDAIRSDYDTVQQKNKELELKVNSITLEIDRCRTMLTSKEVSTKGVIEIAFLPNLLDSQ